MSFCIDGLLVSFVLGNLVSSISFWVCSGTSTVVFMRILSFESGYSATFHQFINWVVLFL